MPDKKKPTDEEAYRVLIRGGQPVQEAEDSATSAKGEGEGKSEAASTTASENKDGKPAGDPSAPAKPGKEDDPFAGEAAPTKEAFKQRLSEETAKRTKAEKQAQEERAERMKLEARLLALEKAKPAEPSKPKEQDGKVKKALDVLNANVDEETREALMTVVKHTADEAVASVKEKQVQTEEERRIEADARYRAKIVEDFPDAAIPDSDLYKEADRIYKADPFYKESGSRGTREAIEKADLELKRRQAEADAQSAKALAETTTLKLRGRGESPGGVGAGAPDGGANKSKEEQAELAIVGARAFKRK